MRMPYATFSADPLNTVAVHKEQSNRQADRNVRFLSRGATLARYMLSSYVRQSVGHKPALYQSG